MFNIFELFKSLKYKQYGIRVLNICEPFVRGKRVGKQKEKEVSYYLGTYYVEPRKILIKLLKKYIKGVWPKTEY